MKPQGPFPRRLMSPLVPEKDANDSNPERGSVMASGKGPEWPTMSFPMTDPWCWYIYIYI